MPVLARYSAFNQPSERKPGRRCCFIMLLILTGLPGTTAGAADDSLAQARQAVVSDPAYTLALFAQQQATLAAAAAWYQRDWYLLAARAHTRLQQFAHAAQHLQQADALLVNGLTSTDLLLTAGFVNIMQQRYADAAYWYQCAANLTLPPLEQSRVQLSLGLIAFANEDWPRAGRYYQQALAIAKTYQQVELIPLLYNNLGLVRWRTGQPDAAIKLLKQAQYQYAGQQQDYSYLMSSLNLLSVWVSRQNWPAYQRAAATFARSVQRHGYQELHNYLQWLHELSVLQQGLSQDSRALQTRYRSIQLPALQQNASALLLQFMPQLQAQLASPPVAAATAFELPQLQQRCGRRQH
jgi:tetratricopeptide (TPR) repeat protein